MAFGNLADNRRVSPIDKMAVLKHRAGNVFSHHETLKCLNRSLVGQQVLDVLSDMVVEFPDAVGIGHVEMQRQVGDPALILVTKPGRLIYLLAYVSDQSEVWLDLPLEAVESVLKLLGQLVSKVFSPNRPARGHQIGDRADMISPSLHGHMLQVEPGVLRLIPLGFTLLFPHASTEPAFHEAWKAVRFDHANPVKVVVAAVFLCRVRVENIRPFQTELSRDQTLQFGLTHHAPLPAKALSQLSFDLTVRKILKRQEIVEHSYRIADAQTPPGCQRHDGFVLWRPIRPVEDHAVFQKKVAIVHKRERRQTETSSRRDPECPPCEQFVELVVDVRMPDDMSAGIGQEQSFYDVEFIVVRLLQTIS